MSTHNICFYGEWKIIIIIKYPPKLFLTFSVCDFVTWFENNVSRYRRHKDQVSCWICCVCRTFYFWWFYKIVRTLFNFTIVRFYHKSIQNVSSNSNLNTLSNNNNQRTSGPVNAHLTSGPGIYFNAFIHVYSPRAERLGDKCWSKQKALITLPICCKFQNDLFEIWFYTHF